jgi:hypothetical protein
MGFFSCGLVGARIEWKNGRGGTIEEWVQQEACHETVRRKSLIRQWTIRAPSPFGTIMVQISAPCTMIAQRAGRAFLDPPYY